MAEKIKIAEIDIDMDKAAEDALALKEEIGLLTAQTAKAKKETGEMSTEYIQYSAALKSAKDNLRSQERMLSNVTKAEVAETGSLDQLKAKLAVVSQKWNALSEEERLNSDYGKDLAAQKLSLTKQLKSEETATGDARRNVGNYTESINDAVGSMDKFIPGVSSAASGAKALGSAFKVMLGPVGLVIAAIASLISYFKRSEEGQNALIKITSVFKTVLNNVLDVADKMGEAIYNAFTNPKEAINELWQLIKSQVQNRIIGLIDQFKALGKVISGVFSADFEKIKEGAKEFGESTVQALTGVDDAINKAKKSLSGFIEEQQKEIEIAKQIADQQAALDKKTRESTVQTAKERLELERLKNEVDDKTNFTAEERLKKIDEENALLDNQQQRLLDIAKQKYEIKVAQNSLSNSTKEDLEEEAQLLADVYNIEADITAKRKEAIAKRIEAENTVVTELKAQAEATVSNMEYELEMWQLHNQSKLENAKELNQEIVNEEISRLNSEAEKEKEILNTRLENKLISLQEYNLQLETLEQEKNANIQAVNNEYQQQQNDLRTQALITNYENEQALLENNLFTQLNIQKEALEKQRAAELENAEKTGANKNLIEQKYAKASKAIESAKADAKLSIAGEAAGNFATILGEETAAGKAAAIAQTTISTYMSATQAFSAMSSIPVVGPALGAIAAAAAIASGIANVKKILAVNTDTSSGSSSSVSSSSSGASSATYASSSGTTSTQTSVGNGIVSRNTVSNQASDQSTNTVLVVDDVTNAQQSESSKVKTSTI